MNSVLWIVLFLAWNRLRKKALRKVAYTQQEDNLSPESYALIVKGLKLPLSEEQLIEHFNIHFREKQIQKIDFIYDLEKLIRLIHKLKEKERQRQVVLLFQHEKSYRIMRFENRRVTEAEMQETPVMRPGFCCIKPKCYPSFREIEERQKELEEEMEQFSEQEKSFRNEKENIGKVGIALVTMRVKKDVQAIATKASRGLFSLIWRPQHLRMGKSKLSIARAPAPSQIIWENLSVKFSWKRFLLTWGITVVVLVTSGLINLSLSDLGEGSFGLSLLAALLLLLVNKVIKVSLYLLSKGEKHSTLTQFETSKMARYLLATFINTALIPFFNNLNPSHYFQEGGLINDLLNIFLVLAFVDPFLSFLDLRFLLLWLHQKYIQQKGDQSGYTQEKANRIFGGVQPAMSEKYADFLLNYLVAMFYLPLFPMGVLLAVLGFWIEHFIEMTLFLRVYQRPPSLSTGLVKAAIVVVLVGLLLHLFSNIYFHSMISSAALVSSLVVTCMLMLVALLLWLLIRKHRLDRSTQNKFWRFIFNYVYVDLGEEGDSDEGNEEYPQEELLEKDYSFWNPMTRKAAHLASLEQQIQKQPDKEAELRREAEVVKNLSFMEYMIRSEQGEAYEKKREEVLAKLKKSVTTKEKSEEEDQKEEEEVKESSKLGEIDDAAIAKRRAVQVDDSIIELKEKPEEGRSKREGSGLAAFRLKSGVDRGIFGLKSKNEKKSQEMAEVMSNALKRKKLPPVKLKGGRSPLELLKEIEKPRKQE